MLLLNRDNFKKEVFQEDKLVVLYFMESDSDFCRMMSPYVDEVEEEYGDRYKFCKLNVSKDRFFALMYRVESTPMLFVLDCGDIKEMMRGVWMPKDIIARLRLDELAK